jgi:hypothetical protein
MHKDPRRPIMSEKMHRLAQDLRCHQKTESAALAELAEAMALLLEEESNNN